MTPSCICTYLIYNMLLYFYVRPLFERRMVKDQIVPRSLRLCFLYISVGPQPRLVTLLQQSEYIITVLQCMIWNIARSWDNGTTY